MSEFKRGDRVRVSYLYSDQADGKLGTFERYEGHLHMVRIPRTTQGAEGEGEVWALYASEVELAPEFKIGDRVIVPHPSRRVADGLAGSPRWPKVGRIEQAGVFDGWLVRVPGWMSHSVHRNDDELTLAPSRVAAV